MNRLRSLVGTAFFIISGAVLAQTSGNGGATYSGLQGDRTDPADAVSRCVALITGISAADNVLLTAVGLQDEAARELAEAKAVSPTSTRGTLEKVITVQSANMEALAQRLNAKELAMTESSKRQFGEGMLDFARSVKAYSELSKELSGQKESFRVPGASAAAALYLAKSLPAYVKNATETLKLAVTFAQANTIPVPQEASALVLAR